MNSPHNVCELLLKSQKAETGSNLVVAFYVYIATYTQKIINLFLVTLKICMIVIFFKF